MIHKTLLTSLLTVVATILTASASAPITAADFNCFTIIAGNQTTADGSVMMAHNEDDGGEQMLNIYMMPSGEWSTGDGFKLQGGGTDTFTAPSARYLWFELPKMDVSDGYLNEYGVGVVSNGCPSREDRTDYTDGGIVYGIRTLTAARARTAREAVKIIGSLVEKWGYASSGRTYCVADNREAWMVSVAQGRHWVATRVPDDRVMVIPNYYTIEQVNLSDTANYLGSRDLVEYATERGWYDPAKDGEFRFSRAYSNPGSYTHPDNISREWSALCKLSGVNYNREDHLNFPTAFKPVKKITPETLMAILSDHYEGTDIDAISRSKSGTPHGDGVGGTICAGSTQFSTIYQLRPNMPTSVGALVWVAPFHACCQLFVPWYIGMDAVPNGWGRYSTAREALENHFTDVADFRKNYPNHPYWQATDKAAELDQSYAERIAPVRALNQAEQQQLFKLQKGFEKYMTKLNQADPKLLPKELFKYTTEWLTPPTPQISTPTPVAPQIR